MGVNQLLAAAALGGLIAGPVLADDDDGYGRHRGHGRHGHRHLHGHEIVYAPVVSVRPLVRYVTVERPRQECWQDVEYRSAVPGHVVATTLAGGIVGAAIGRQFGDGRGRDALTLMGAVAGSAVAHAHAVRRNPESTYTVPVERCQVVNERFTEEIIEGYDVVYRYHGRRYSIRTAEHPGGRIPLEMSLRPVRL
jgi:uncharacterized protein YcfJ